MASDIEVRAAVTTDDLSVGDVYDGMRLGAEDISEKSPITPGLREVSAVIGEDSIALRVQGHDGEWSKTSEDALTEALGSVDGVDASTVDVVSGGYETEAADVGIGPGPGEDEDDESPDVSEIDGVGEARAAQLREAGIETVADVLEGGAEALVEAGLADGVAENIVERA